MAIVSTLQTRRIVRCLDSTAFVNQLRIALVPRCYQRQRQRQCRQHQVQRQRRPRRQQRKQRQQQ